MANEVDPNSLIALMCYEYRNLKHDFPRRSDTTNYAVVSGVTEDEATNVRTFPVLDALARISVYQPDHQVVATALQLDRVNCKTRLIIAQNRGPDEKVVRHITSVWAKLQILSSAYAENRRAKNMGMEQDEGGESLEILAEIGVPLKIEIFREVYLFSLAKHAKRVRKWKDGLLAFMRKFGRSRRGQLRGFDLDLHETATPLFFLLKALNELHEHPERGLTRDEWADMYRLSMLVSGRVERVFGKGFKERRRKFACEALANELKDPGESRSFQLRRALEKLTSLSRTIDALFSFAHSPRLRPALQYKMLIYEVPDQTHTVRLPQTRPEWLSVLQGVLKDDPTIEGDWALEKARELSEGEDTPWGGVVHVHCECALIRRLMTEDGSNWDNVSPFSYIGVSKLSCSACYLWIEAFNDQSGRKFYTRGSHGKWYWPWVMPESGEDLKQRLVKKVSKLYLPVEYQAGHTRMGTDSSDPDTAGAQPRLSTAEEVSTVSKMSQESRGFGNNREEFYDHFS